MHSNIHSLNCVVVVVVAQHVSLFIHSMLVVAEGRSKITHFVQFIETMCMVSAAIATIRKLSMMVVEN